VKARQKKADAFAASVGPIASALQSQGLTFQQIAAELTERDIRTPPGTQSGCATCWHGWTKLHDDMTGQHNVDRNDRGVKKRGGATC
jgi:hypothetical protein